MTTGHLPLAGWPTGAEHQTRLLRAEIALSRTEMRAELQSAIASQTRWVGTVLILLAWLPGFVIQLGH